MPDSKIQDKLATARTRLILDKPFLGALALRLPLIAADPGWCETATTDARKLYYNPGYIDALDVHETQFVLAKQALHCALSHFARRQHRVTHRWNLACDYAVNPLLIDDGLKAPPGTRVEERYEGMAAEEIYHCIRETDDVDDEPAENEQDPQQQSDRGDPGENSGNPEERPRGSTPDEESENKKDQSAELAQQPPQLTPQEREALSIQWQQRLAGAAQQAMQAGKLQGAMARLVDHILQPRLPWRMLLARYMTASARDDYSYTRPSSRRGGPAIFPSLRSAQINVSVGVDTSGSVSDNELNEFISELDAIKGSMRARITLLPCDAALAEGAPWIFEPWEALALPGELNGGGGTDFRPVFDWLDAQDLQPDLLVYFTDCQGAFPDTAPGYPVIWVVKGKDCPPWGQRVQLN